MTLTVAIVGRPNVGKSTLFNRLVGRREAIVHDMPGVTRDRLEGQATLGDIAFRLIDTAGLEEAFDDSLEARMRIQTDRAIAEADVTLFLIDARAGVTPLDEHFADHLRRGNRPVLLVANKCEGRAGAPGLYEAYGLGLGEPIPVSAEHGEGMGDLHEALRPFAEKAGALMTWDDPEDEAPPAEIDEEWEGVEDDGRPISLAIVGRPNVGKSTLVNRLIGEDRLLTGPEAGVTRDAITVEHDWKGRRVMLVDTAGLRRKARVTHSLEKLSVADTLHAINMANVVVLLLDPDGVLDKQDLTIARQTVDEGRALVIAINKWDQVKDRQGVLARLNDRLQTSLPQVKGVPTVTCSAKTGKGLDRLLDAVLDVYALWNTRVSTGRLNRWLEAMTDAHLPPLSGSGRRIRLRYMTQAKTRPPTFAIFANKPEDLPDSYTRYLVNGLRETFKLDGIPIRINIRKPKNPYA